jgi:hypothetical protein
MPSSRHHFERSAHRVALAVAFAIVTWGCSDEHVTTTQRVCGLVVTLTMPKRTLARGDAALGVGVSGVADGDAAVSVRYRLPPMPGMASRDYVASVSRTPEGYAVPVSLHTAGSWTVDVAIAQPRRSGCVASFPLDVR